MRKWSRPIAIVAFCAFLGTHVFEASAGWRDIGDGVWDKAGAKSCETTGGNSCTFVCAGGQGTSLRAEHYERYWYTSNDWYWRAAPVHAVATCGAITIECRGMGTCEADSGEHYVDEPSHGTCAVDAGTARCASFGPTNPTHAACGRVLVEVWTYAPDAYGGVLPACYTIYQFDPWPVPYDRF